jgi:hypothetical protein
MLALLLHNRNAWDDYFPVTNPNYYTTRQTPSDKHVYVSNSLGVRCHAHQRHIVESSSFISCKTSSQKGGAIYFFNIESGECVLNEVCGYDCCSANNGSYSYYRFACIVVKNDTSSVHCVNELKN